MNPSHKNPMEGQFWKVIFRSVFGLFIGLNGACIKWGNSDSFEVELQPLAEKKERFQKDLAVYASLDPTEASKIERLYRDLLQLEKFERERLWFAAEGFSMWLARLDDSDRNAILELGDTKERLALVRKLREGQWLSALPIADQQNIRELEKDPDSRALLISRIRAEEIERKSRNIDLARKPSLPSNNTKTGSGPLAQNKSTVTANTRPAKFEELPNEVQLWLGENLLPRLSEFEKNQVRLASGRWPDYPRIIYQLTRDHFLLPQIQPRIESYSDIPGPIREKYTAELVGGLMDKKGWAPPKPLGQDYALALAKWAVLEKIPTGFIGPTNATVLPEPWRVLVEKNLTPRLVREERQFLRRAEGKWPEYPRALIDLLVSRRMTVPGNVLPGPPSLWQDALSPK